MKASTLPATDPMNVYLIGNNPIELSSIYDKLKTNFRAEICFELKGLYSKIRRFRPQCILIDDNLDRVMIKKILRRLSSRNITRDIPVTIIKNNNYTEGFSEAQDFVLKNELTSEGLSRSIKNSIRMKRMQYYLIRKYRKNKGRIQNWWSVISGSEA